MKNNRPNKMQSNLIPNSTQIPNVLMDFVIPAIPYAEGKCLLYICRRTFGFHKDRDRISFSQFINGVKKRDGQILDLGTGLVRGSVNKALKNLVKSEAIFVEKSSKGNIYEINLKADFSQVVQKIDQCIKYTKSSAVNRPKVVHLLHSQKKGNIGNKERICLKLKKWSESQSSPILNFRPENIVNKHGAEKVEQLLLYYGQRNGGFSQFLSALKN